MIALKERFQLVVQRMQIKFIQRLLLKSRVVPEQSQPQSVDVIVVLESLVVEVHSHQRIRSIQNDKR